MSWKSQEVAQLGAVIFLAIYLCFNAFMPLGYSDKHWIVEFKGINESMCGTNSTAPDPVVFECIKFCAKQFGHSSTSSLNSCYDQCALLSKGGAPQ